LEKICKGQTLTIDETELGTLKYRGKFPTSIASLIKMQAAEGSLQMSRVSDLQLEFKDSRFHITGISEPKDDFSGSGSVGGLPPVPGVGPITPAPGQSSSEFGSTPQVPTPSTAP
jgi:hypothetical protein